MAIPAIITYCTSNGWVPYSGTFSSATPYVLQDSTNNFVMYEPNSTQDAYNEIVFQYIGTNPEYFNLKCSVNILLTAAEQQSALTSFMNLCVNSAPGGSAYPLTGGV